MTDPEDFVTMPLPQPMRLRFASNGRFYTAALTQDLLEDWTVVQSWSGTDRRPGGGKVTLVASFDAGVALLDTIARFRTRQGYKPV